MYPTTPATVVAVVDVVRRLWPKKQPARAAILTSRDVDTTALVAAALADAQQLPLRVFRDYDEAIAWLQGAPAAKAADAPKDSPEGAG